MWFIFDFIYFFYKEVIRGFGMQLYEKLKDPIAFSVFLLTLTLPVLVGFVALRRTKNQSDFLVGGRSMNRFVVALSAVSSGRSAWLVLGLSGMAYKMGITAIWAVVGYVVAELFQFVYLGKKLRTRTEQYGSLTLLDFFESHFDDKKNLIRITGSVIIAIFITAYVAAQFSGGAKTLSAALDISMGFSLVVTGVLILVYMVLGGFIAVAYNDAVRAVIMVIGLAVLPIVGLLEVGGYKALLEILERFNPAHLDPVAMGGGALINFIGIGLGSPGQPHIVVRYMSIKDPQKLASSAVIGTFWNVMMGWGAVLIGLVGKAKYTDVTLLPESNPELIYLALSMDYFGPVFYGLLIGGIFAAILSTADSQLLVVASTFVRDIYEKVCHKNDRMHESRKLLLSRIVLVLAGIVSLFLAYMAEDLIFWLVLFAWGGLGASFGTALIMVLYWKGTTKWGVFFGMLIGTTTTIGWNVFLKDSTGVYELIPAFFAAVLILVLVSLVTKNRESEY